VLASTLCRMNDEVGMPEQHWCTSSGGSASSPLLECPMSALPIAVFAFSLRLWWQSVCFRWSGRLSSVEWCLGLALVVRCGVVSCGLGPCCIDFSSVSR
jgi:hypothetical protein